MLKRYVMVMYPHARHLCHARHEKLGMGLGMSLLKKSQLKIS